MKKLSKLLVTFTLILSLVALAACGSDSSSDKASGGSSAKKKDLVIGASAGPYSDMVNKAIKPLLEKKGYSVKVVEFNDYVQPNLALSKGDLDANLFQHKIYMETFAKQHHIGLSEVISVPTAPMGVYSKKFKSKDEIKDGSTIAIASDPSNLARTLLMLQSEGLITVKKDMDSATASEKDVADNPKHLKFQPVEAAQLPRLVDSVDLVAVPGNYALAANMNLLDALFLEKMTDDYRNRVVVNTKDVNSQFAKDIKDVVQSKEFEAEIDKDFKGFGKPEWMTNR